MSDLNNPVCERSDAEIRTTWKTMLFAKNTKGKTFLRNKQLTSSALGKDIQNCIRGTALGSQLIKEHEELKLVVKLGGQLTAEQERRKKPLFLLTTDRWQSEKGEKKDTDALINVLTTLTVVVREQTDESKKNSFLKTIIHYLVTTVWRSEKTCKTIFTAALEKVFQKKPRKIDMRSACELLEQYAPSLVEDWINHIENFVADLNKSDAKLKLFEGIFGVYGPARNLILSLDNRFHFSVAFRRNTI